VARIAAEGRCPIFDVDVRGGLNLKRQYGAQALAIFLAPPSLAALRTRLVQRGKDSAEDIERRLNKAQEEMAYAPQFDQQVVNDVLEVSTAQVAQLIESFLAV